jgi:hypothetical protein
MRAATSPAAGRRHQGPRPEPPLVSALTAIAALEICPSELADNPTLCA